MELKSYFAQDDQGNRLPGATCYLYVRGTESLITNLFRVNGTPLANPFVTDDSGLAQFAAANGLYDLRVMTPTRDFRLPIQFNDVGESVTAAQLAAVKAESARDASQLSGGVFATTQAGLAATAEGKYFSVPIADLDAFLVLYKNSGNAPVEVGRYPNSKAVSSAELAAASASMTSDLTFVSSWASDANNGGTIINRYGRACGFNVPVGATGWITYLTAMFPAASADTKALTGSTVQAVITGRYTGDFSVGVKLNADRSFRALRAGGVPYNVGRLISESYSDGRFKRVVQYTVTDEDTQIGVILSVANGQVATIKSTLIIDRIAFGIVTAAQKLTPYTAASLEREKIFDEINANAGLSWQWEPTLFESGYGSFPKGAVTLPEGAVAPAIAGLKVPVGSTGALAYFYNVMKLDPDQVTLMTGSTVRIVAKFTATAGALELLDFQFTPGMRVARGTAGSVVVDAKLVSMYQEGSILTKVIDYVVDGSDVSWAVTLGVHISALAPSLDVSAQFKSLSWSVREAAVGSKRPADVAMSARFQELIKPTEQRIAALKEPVIPENYTGVQNVTGSQLETKSFTNFTPVIQAFTVNKLGGLVKTVEQMVTVTAPDTVAVSNFAFSLVAAPSGGALPGVRLLHQYSANRVVKRVSDGVVLNEGVDYAVKPNTCYIYGLKSIASTPCTISYTGYLHRYDLISLDLETGNLVVTKGTGRAIDPEEYKPVMPRDAPINLLRGGRKS